jgi:signal transduction histidine kinase/ActR/RegA family two-component response regulator
MSLRWKVTLILFLLLAATTIAKQVLHQRILGDSFQRLERKQADEDLIRCTAAIQREEEQLATFCRTWSAWDDACTFIQKPTPDFIKSNMVPDAFVNNQLSVIWWIDPAGKCVWGEFHDEKTGQAISLPEFPALVADPANHLQGFTAPHQETSGILLTSRGPLLIVAQPIVTAENKGPVRGTVIQGRFLSDSRLEQLKKQTRVDFRFWQDNGIDPIDDPVARQAAREVGGERQDEQVLRMYARIADLSGRGGLILRADIPRDITRQGNRAQTFLTFASLITGVLTLVFLWGALQWLVVGPLRRLTRHVVLAGRSDSFFGTKPPPVRNDEIGVLTAEFGRMFSRVHESEIQLLSERDRAEQAAASATEARELAMAANNAKSEFLARMSHEIRTPLNGVAGMIDLLQATELTESQQRYTRLAREAADTLLCVINDILDFSKIEAGKVEIESIEFDLYGLVEELVELLVPAASRKGLELTCWLHPEVQPLVCGDPVRVRQVLTNLLSNAIKFTAKGSIHIHLWPVSRDSGRQIVRFEVNDSGLGIPADRIDRLFKGFSQVDSSTTRKYGGTGLGLAISKRLVELMGGEITVKSEPGKGTTFSFTLNVGMVNGATAIAPAPPKAPPVSLSGLHLLVAEDNEMNQFVTQEMLKRAGCTCEIVADGAAALEAVARGRYDVVLMDCQMPVMDGREATRRIRQREAATGSAKIPIIALTAEAIQGDREKCIECGMDGYVTKPINSADLIAAIGSLTQRAAA